MAKYCTICDQDTNCTDSCKICAKETYEDLKRKAGKAEFVSEDAIRNDLGDGAFELLKEFNHIEFCGVVGGKRMYAI